MTRYLLILFAALQLNAASYYVATNGSDAAAGTVGAPWATVTHALATVAGGSTILCYGGVYTNETWPVGTAGWPNGSDEAHRTLLTSYSGIATFLPQGIDDHGFLFQGATFVTLSNVVVNMTNINSTSRMSCLRIYLSDHVKVANSELCGTPSGHGVLLVSSYSNEVRDCHIHDLGWNYPGEPTAQDHGIYCRGSSNVFSGNRIHDLTISNNIVTTYSIGIKVSENDDINSNLIYNNLCYRAGAGISINHTSDTQGNYCWNNVCCYNSQYGLKLTYDGAENWFMHNTCYSNDLAGVFIQDRTLTNWFINNITALGSVNYDNLAGGYGVRADVIGDKTYIQGALSYDNKDGLDIELFTADIVTNNCLLCGTTNIVEQFVDPSRSAMNFQLLSSSLAVDRGVAITGLPEPVQTLIGYDYLGHARPTGVAPDIGAYEYAQTQPSLIKLKNLRTKLIKVK